MLEEEKEKPDASSAKSKEVDTFKLISENQAYKELICPLCFKFIFKCVTAFCNHSFCEKCLDEYLILKKVYLIFSHHFHF
jgi:hypothetical protein